MKFIVILPCLIFSGLLSLSQKKAPIQSADIIITASQLYDSGDYKKSIQLYEQIDQNDSNYVKSLYGIALNCESDSQYSKGILVCEKALQLKEQRELEADLYNTFGNILNHAGQKEKSLLIFNEAITKYPTYPFLYFNKGVLLFEQDKFSEAATIFKQTLLVNPYQYSAHFYLGLCAIHEGNIVPAFLSFVGYLLVNPDGKYNKRCINILASIGSGKDEILEYKSKRKAEPEENYLMTEEILLSKIALDKEYKIKVSLDDPIFRQIQVVFEKLEYKEDDTDFWMQYYVPFYKKLFTEDQFEPFIFWTFENVQIKEIQDYNKKNKKLVDHFTTETADYFNKIRSTETLEYNKRLVQRNNYYYSNGILQGKGELTDDEKNFQGAWTFFYPQGNIKCKGQYSAAAREGNWTFYYFSGNQQAHENYKNGKLDGRQLYYSERGLLTQDDMYLNDQPNGTQIAYWANGRVYSTSSYIAGKQEGEYKEFSSGGKLIAVKNYVKNALSGPFNTYYPDGQLKESGNYLHGNLDGSYKDYYENGQLNSEGLLKNGTNDGEWKTYYDNGIVKSKSRFTNLKQEGIEEEFYENGALKSTYTYQKGNLDGEAFNYDLNHRPYARFIFSKNKLESAVYLDSSGKISSTYERKNKILELDIFDAEKTKIAHRSFDENGALTGRETYYYPSGKISQVNHYINGEKTGVSTEYYPNGKPKSEINMNVGKMEGSYITYFQSGGIESEGWTRDGQSVGYWNYYNEMGNLSSINYYDNGVLSGYKLEYNENGTKFLEKKFYKGLLESLKQFDSTGKLLVYDTFPQFSGKFLLVYPNGNKMQEGNYINGVFDGSLTQFYFDGSVEFRQYFKNGLLDSDYIAYEYPNVREAEGHYKSGKKTGLWKSYYENGQLEWTATYAFDELQGPRRFFDNNNKIIGEINYNHDERDSIAFKIEPEGKLLYSIRYDKGTVKGYTYQGKDGIPMSEIKTENGILSVESFFQNGNPSRHCQFIDNSLNGTDLIYHSNGNIYLQDSLVFGISEGQSKEYAFNGKLVKLFNYKNNRLHGKYLEYNSNGVLIRDLNYYNNSKHGESKYYSDNGSLVETRHYFYGILLEVKK